MSLAVCLAAAAAVLVLLVVLAVGLVALVRRVLLKVEALRSLVVGLAEEQRARDRRLSGQVHRQGGDHSDQLAAVADYIVRELRAERVLERLRALPVMSEPVTEEEIAIFESAEAELRAGRRASGITTADVIETLETMKRAEEARARSEARRGQDGEG